MNTRTRWVIGATTAIIIVAAIAIVLATGPGTPKQTATAHHRTTKSCDTGPADSAIPTAPPPDLEWKNIGPVLVPASATHGPTRYDGHLWTCYRHDPMGAVLAAYDIFAAAITTDWLQIAQNQFVPGPGQQATEQQSFRPPQPDQVAQPVGFQIVSYTPQQATVETLADAGNGQYQAEERTVGWSGGDWKLVLTPDGSTGPDPQLVSSADGFVLWGGTNG